MANQLNIFLLTLGVAQGALLGMFLLRKQKPHPANMYFVLILVVVGLQLTFKVISKVWLMESYRLPYILSYYLPFLIGPLLFLYIKSRKSEGFGKADWLHFTPFLLLACGEVLLFYRIASFHFMGFSPYSRATLQLISLGMYGILAWRILQQDAELRRLKPFLIRFISCEVIIVVTFAVMYVYYGRFPDVRLFFVALTLFIYWISYKQMEQPDLFIIQGHSPALQFQLQSHSKYNHSSLKQEEANRIVSSLNHAMHQQRLYLDSDLSIDSLSRQLNASRHHISQVLNERFQQTYADYVNDLRLAEAKSRLQNARYNHFTIAAIAMDSGFSSVSNFNELFKRKFGKTPSQCRTEGLGKMTA